MEAVERSKLCIPRDLCCCYFYIPKLPRDQPAEGIMTEEIPSCLNAGWFDNLPALTDFHQLHSIAACNELIRNRTSMTPKVVARDDPILEVTRGNPDVVVGPIRVVSIEGLDSNLCCGTHVSNLAVCPPANSIANSMQHVTGIPLALHSFLAPHSVLAPPPPRTFTHRVRGGPRHHPSLHRPILPHVCQRSMTSPGCISFIATSVTAITDRPEEGQPPMSGGALTRRFV